MTPQVKTILSLMNRIRTERYSLNLTDLLEINRLALEAVRALSPEETEALISYRERELIVKDIIE